MTASTRLAAGVFVALLACGCRVVDDANDRETPSYFGNTIRLALAEGNIERATDAARRAVGRYPSHAVILRWNAVVAQMHWDEERALAMLRRVRESDDFGGLDQAELLGEIGDLMFRVGSYTDSIPYLNAGTVGPRAPRRAALVTLARELPYARLQPGKLVAELPLLDGALPTLLCAVGDKHRPFVLDTGASMTALARSMAEELGVDPVIEAGQAVDGVDREFAASLGVLHALSLGTVRLDSQPVLVVADNALSLSDPFGGPARVNTSAFKLATTMWITDPSLRIATPSREPPASYTKEDGEVVTPGGNQTR